MKKAHGIAWVLLCIGLAAAPANAAASRTTATGWWDGMALAARAWVGQVLGVQGLTPQGGSDGLRAVTGKDEGDTSASIFKLKQHVDNPGQTPMKD